MLNIGRIKRFLIQEEEIGGIEISDSKIRIAYLQPLSSKETTIKRWGELDLQSGIIEKGEVKNKEILASNLRILLDKIFPPAKKQFWRFGKPISRVFPVVVSIPSQRAYSQVFSFPGRIPYEQLEESMELTIGFSLPLPAENVYLDWEVINQIQEEEKEILLTEVKKSIIDPYLETFSKTEFLPIACELYSMSLNRIISNIEENPFCIVLATEEGIEIIISKLKNIRFVRSVYWQDHRYFREKNILDTDTKKKILADELWRTINFDQTEKEGPPIGRIYLIGNVSDTLGLKEYLKVELGKEVIVPEAPYKFFGSFQEAIKEKNATKPLQTNVETNSFKENRALVAFGAALRGFIPRGKDVSVSLLPVGTEEEYSQTRINSFLNFVKIWATSALLIFIFIFVGAYFFLLVAGKYIYNQASLVKLNPPTEELKKIEQESIEFNKNLNLMEFFSKDMANWSVLLEELKNKKNDGITYNRISAGSYQGIMSLGGRALTRDQLLLFRDNLTSSKVLTDIDLPERFFDKKENIDFTITFKIK